MCEGRQGYGERLDSNGINGNDVTQFITSR